MPYSHHSHSGEFCKHATGTLKDVVLAAINQGFEVYGLSEHVPRYRLLDLYPEEVGMSLETLEKQFHNFVEEAHRLKAFYADRINLLVGLETEYITTADLSQLELLLENLGPRVQYLVGSIHHVNCIPIDFDLDTFYKARGSTRAKNEKQAQEMFFEAYLDAQFELMNRFQPEIIGHIDLCRLYTPELRFAEYPAALERLKRNIKYARDYGALFEVNTAALSKRWDTAYPGRDVLEAILFHGRVTLSDDSHGPQAVGRNYDSLREYLISSGVTELWYLEESLVPNGGGRMTRAKQLNMEWWNHPFWKERMQKALQPNMI
ncbi:hypothetical protein AMATHDRAFT_137612 [Amanita thiersii Skay4041]|uniref:Histidinol-phosphatase n=1 Tax=Amanita thiersii Skay4041 TaxID=703135 RepID=A0A2A9NZN8_9AGAR|nr:hypothetical protein AMATHDRAFT_137612 [Amanita thiersii Skay4041]